MRRACGQSSCLAHWAWSSASITGRRSFPAASSSACAVARALANKPPLVLADEPTGNLDEATADRVLAEFLSLVRGEGSAALVATHNERLALKVDRVVRLHEGHLE